MIAIIALAIDAHRAVVGILMIVSIIMMDTLRIGLVYDTDGRHRRSTPTVVTERPTPYGDVLVTKSHRKEHDFGTELLARPFRVSRTPNDFRRFLMTPLLVEYGGVSVSNATKEHCQWHRNAPYSPSTRLRTN
jgi:hypothetical protein